MSSTPAGSHSSYRAEQFFAALDTLATGETTLGPDAKSFIADAEQWQSLGHAAGMALRATGVEAASLTLDADSAKQATTSLVFAAKTETDTYAVRVQPPGFSSPYPAEALARSTAFDTGLRTPRIHASHHDVSDTLPFTFTVEDFAEGQNGYHAYQAAGDRLLGSLSLRMGMSLATIHTCQIDQGYGYFDTDAAHRGTLAGQHPTYYDHLTAGLDTALGHVVDHDRLTYRQSTQLHDYLTGADIVQQLATEPAVLSHGDMAFYNLLVPEDGIIDDRITTVDFGETRAAPVAHDLAAASLYLVRNGWESYTKDVLAGYSAAGGELPANVAESLRAIRLRYLVSVVAGQAVFAAQHPEATGLPVFLNRATQALTDEAKALRIT